MTVCGCTQDTDICILPRDKKSYQLPLILTALKHVAWETLSISRHVPLSGHDEVALFEWRRQWHWIDTIIENYVIIASLKSETTGKLIIRIPGLCLLISGLPGSALRTHVESLGKPLDVNKHLKALPGTLEIKRHCAITEAKQSTVSKMRYARNQPCFYTIRNTTKTNIVKHRGAIYIELLIYILSYFRNSEYYYVLQKDWRPNKYQFLKFMVIHTNDPNLIYR